MNDLCKALIIQCLEHGEEILVNASYQTPVVPPKLLGLRAYKKLFLPSGTCCLDPHKMAWSRSAGTKGLPQPTEEEKRAEPLPGRGQSEAGVGCMLVTTSSPLWL